MVNDTAPRWRDTNTEELAEAVSLLTGFSRAELDELGGFEPPC